MDPDPIPDQAPDPTPDPALYPTPSPFFLDFKDAKRFHIFSYNLHAGALSSVLKI
jgi:hypothetical protein